MYCSVDLHTEALLKNSSRAPWGEKAQLNLVIRVRIHGRLIQVTADFLSYRYQVIPKMNTSR